MVRLLIFSGRPDPQWSLDADEAEGLAERLAESVGREKIHPPPLAGLGYRGFRLILTEQGPTEFVVYRSVVTENPGRAEVYWRDVGRVERWLLDDARRRGYGDLLDATKAGEED